MYGSKTERNDVLKEGTKKERIKEEMMYLRKKGMTIDGKKKRRQKWCIEGRKERTSERMKDVLMEGRKQPRNDVLK